MWGRSGQLVYSNVAKAPRLEMVRRSVNAEIEKVVEYLLPLVMLNLFQHNAPPLVILKQVQDDDERELV
jgi:hypothetical protein